MTKLLESDELGRMPLPARSRTPPGSAAIVTASPVGEELPLAILPVTVELVAEVTEIEAVLAKIRLPAVWKLKAVFAGVRTGSLNIASQLG